METPAQKQTSLITLLVDFVEQLKRENQLLRQQLDERSQAEGDLRRVLLSMSTALSQSPALPALQPTECLPGDDLWVEAQSVENVDARDALVVQEDWTPGRRLDGTIVLASSSEGSYTVEPFSESPPRLHSRTWWRFWE